MVGELGDNVLLKLSVVLSKNVVWKLGGNVLKLRGNVLKLEVVVNQEMLQEAKVMS